MGCRYTKMVGCYSLTCCCCVEADEACWWIGAVGVVGTCPYFHSLILVFVYKLSINYLPYSV